MMINEYEIDNDLFQLYCYSIKCVIRSPTRSADKTRRRIHNQLLDKCGVCRDDHEFDAELSRLVYEAIGFKSTVRY